MNVVLQREFIPAGLRCTGLSSGKAHVRIIWKHSAAALLLVSTASTVAARKPDPIVITLDGRHYVTYTGPVVIALGERLVVAPEARMANCRRGGGGLLIPDLLRLTFSLQGESIDANSMRIEFDPARIVVDTLLKDVICDGEASSVETGIGRVFRDDFEPD